MKIYTKTGDTGETGLYGGTRRPKDDIRLETIGTIDELNASIGNARAVIEDLEIDQILHRVQNELFDIGADLATLETHQASSSLRISADYACALEHDIDRAQDQLPPMTHFVLPGGSIGGSALHLSRTVCRRGERCAVRLARTESINVEVPRYLNRLSDLLFVLARLVNHRVVQPEPFWRSPFQRTSSEPKAEEGANLSK